MSDSDRPKPPRSVVWLARGLSLGFALFLLLVAEGVTRLLVTETNLDSILSVLEQHPIYFWRNKPNLDGTFRKNPVRTSDRGFRLPPSGENPAKGEGPLIFAMGASPTFGFGARYVDAYPYQLAELLHKRSGKDALRVVNGGMIGHSTFQGVRVQEHEVFPLKPKLITIGYVLNDLDKYRFFQSNGKPDTELESKAGTLLAIRNVLTKSAFFRVVERNLFFAMGRRDSAGQQSMEVHPPMSVRVPIPDYKKNIKTMIQRAQQRGIGVVLLKMPVNLPKEPPVSEADRKEADALTGQAIARVQADDCAAAEPLLKKALEHRPNLSLAHYYLGSCARKAGDLEQSRAHVDRAMKAEGRRCGSDGVRYNAAMAEVARETGLPLVDVVAAFEARKGQYLFVDPKEDPTHPNRQGHAIIAELLAGAIARHHPELLR